MDAERWSQIEEVFHRAADLEGQAREEFLHTACTGDEDLRHQVDSLLAASEGAQARFEGAVRGTLASAARHREPERRHIGPYRVVQELGEGGLSTVYLAERDDRQYRMRVAVKVVKRGMDTREILRRLRQERQILANLDHPYVAKLLDGGTTDDGLPYFVMEYIEGEHIDVYCQRRGLSIERRLELFCRACSAVHYAHQNLVVHRDIKPANLLITADGTPKLLDFGIAKVLGPGQLEQTVVATAAEIRLLTPEYASPEQIRGEALTTATDVYSLGVLLYRLLTGRPPYRFASRRPQEIERVVCQTEPVRPSSIVAAGGDPGEPGEDPETLVLPPEKLRRRLQGDLDNIVLMALRKRPERRYASVEQMAQDVRRHLAGRAVVARPATFGYRAGKFLRRNRSAVVLAAAAVLLVSALVGFYTVRLAHERDRARLEASKAEEVSNFLESLFDIPSASSSKVASITARDLLNRGEERIDLELSDQPEVRATMMDLMGKLYSSLALYDRAGPLLERALELRQQELGPDHPDVAETLSHLAGLAYERGEYQAAEAHLRRTLAIQRRAFGNDDPRLARTLTDLAACLQALEDFAEAEALYRQALTLQTATPALREAETFPLTQHNFATLFHQRGDLARAEPLYRQALQNQRALPGGRETPDYGRFLSNLAALLQARGELGEAELLYREALELQRRLHRGEDHLDLTASLNNLATLLEQEGEVKQAVDLYRQALAMERRLLGLGHPDTETTHQNLTSLLERLGDAQGAAALRE